MSCAKAAEQSCTEGSCALLAQEEYRNTPEAKRAKASSEAAEQTGQPSPDYNQYDPAIWGSSALPASPAEDLISAGGSPGSTMDITNRTMDLANSAFPQPGLDSPSVIPKPFGDITAGLQSFADLAADVATTDEIGWEQPAAQGPAGNITAGVPALSTLLEEDEEGRTCAYGDENMSVNMELTTGMGTECVYDLFHGICLRQSEASHCLTNAAIMSYTPMLFCVMLLPVSPCPNACEPAILYMTHIHLCVVVLQLKLGGKRCNGTACKPHVFSFTCFTYKGGSYAHLSQCQAKSFVHVTKSFALPGTQAGQPAKPAQNQDQSSPQQLTGSVMMDLTDGNTRETAPPRGATTDYTLGGYTKAIEQGNHPVWGSQRAAQQEDTTAVQARPTPTAAAADATADPTLGGYTRAIEQGNHPAWGSQRTAQLDPAHANETSPMGVVNASGFSASAGKNRRSRLAQSPSAAQGRVSLAGQSPLPVKGKISLAGQSPSAVQGRMSTIGQSPSVMKRAQPEGQRSKWGFVPGEDDTLDLNMEKAGMY